MDSTPNPTLTTLVASVIRSVLALLSGLGLAVGTYNDSSLTFAASVVVGVGTAAWSIYQKISAARKAHLSAQLSAAKRRPMRAQ